MVTNSKQVWAWTRITRILGQDGGYGKQKSMPRVKRVKLLNCLGEWFARHWERIKACKHKALFTS